MTYATYPGNTGSSIVTTDAAACKEQPYTYQLTPYGGLCNTFTSTPVSVTMRAPENPNLTVTRGSDVKLSLSWVDGANNNTDNFTIERCAGTGCSNFSPLTTTPATLAGTATGYDDTTVLPDMTYNYRINANGPVNGSCTPPTPWKVTSTAVQQTTSISTPVLVDVKLNMGSAEVSKVFPENLPPISHGSRLLIKGRYSKAASAEMTLTGTLNNVEHVFPINATFVEKSEDNLFIRQLWSKDNAGNRTQATAGAEPQLSDQNSVTARTFVRCSETRPLSFWGIYGFLPTIFALPLSRTRHNGGGHRACLANQRVLYGAIEMYNMDNNVMIDELDQETMDNLLKGQYLKSPMVMAKKECCFSITDALYSEDSIVCSVHGNSEIELEENSDQQTSDMFREGVYLEIIDKKQLVINKSEIIHEEDSWLKKTWNSWLADVVNLLINVPLFIIGLVLSFYLTYLILLLPFKLLAGLFELLSGKEK